MPRLVRVRALEGARLFVEFDDGTAGEIDLSTRLFGPVFEPLADPDIFAAVAIDEFGAPCWPTGADLAPDAIYEKLTGTGAEAVAE
jgi:hypothetical protein